jgi:hypothetical protein
MHRRNLTALFFFLPIILCPLLAPAQATLKQLPAAAEASVPAAIRNAVESSGAQLVRSEGSVLCEIWMRKSPLPAAKAAATKGTTYSELSPGIFVGLISFPGGGKDFRGQPVKGWFTMRYVLLPEDGNHLGVAPTRDFVLLVRAKTDTDPNAQYDYAQLVKLSAEAAGTNHPAAFLVLSPTPSPNPGADKGGPLEPRTYQNADGFQVFAGMLNVDGKSAPIALVVKGQAEQ